MDVRKQEITDDPSIYLDKLEQALKLSDSLYEILVKAPSMKEHNVSASKQEIQAQKPSVSEPNLSLKDISEESNRPSIADDAKPLSQIQHKLQIGQKKCFAILWGKLSLFRASCKNKTPCFLSLFVAFSRAFLVNIY